MLYPSTDPRPAALRWHWGQLFRGGLMWLRPEEGWDGVSWAKKIWEGKRWLSVLTGPTQYFNHLTPILHFILPSQMPKTASQNLKIIFYLPAFHIPSVFSRPSVSYFPACFFLPVSLTLFPSCCPLYLLLIDHLSVTLCFPHPLSLCLNMVSMKTNVTPRIHGIYFPAKVNPPPCNEDRSSLKRTERWRERAGKRREREREMICISTK